MRVLCHGWLKISSASRYCVKSDQSHVSAMARQLAVFGVVELTVLLAFVNACLCVSWIIKIATRFASLAIRHIGLRPSSKTS